SMHMIALGVKKRTGLPWLADFRDPWTNIDFYHELMLTAWADKKHHRQELSVLKQADEVVVISNSMKSDFIKIHNRAYSIITNGYDEDDVLTEKVETDNKFSISHIGTMVKTRNPEVLWRVLNAEATMNQDFASDLEIKLVGSVDYSVSDSIENAGLGKFVNKVSYLPHNEVIRVQQQSQVLLLLINETPNAKVILPGKFFEYMASHRPILCIGPLDGDAAQVITETKSGYVIENSDFKGMQQAIRQLYANFKSGKSAVDSQGIEKYSRKQLTVRLAGCLDKISR
ncbi:MAG: glycosyltransferase family 4 protein, partial [Lentimicrobium sp.]|nr:glycosyltransferase family 4 protein [Lentimicrobium sp.]